MPSDLTAKVCVPCQGGIPPLTSTEAEAYSSLTFDANFIYLVKSLKCKCRLSTR